jgi:F0F1-type ATP synthase assembly protein I
MPFNPPIPESSRPPRQSGAIKSIVEAEKMIQIAFLLPSSVLVGGLAGFGLDKLFHRSWFLLPGILFGGFSGLVYVVRLGIAAGKRSNARRESDSNNSGSNS